MRLTYFILRLLALPFTMAFLLIGGALYVIFLSLAWVVIGETITIRLTLPDWRP
jgi:uncharacterized membrane protein YccC